MSCREGNKTVTHRDGNTDQSQGRELSQKPTNTTTGRHGSGTELSVGQQFPSVTERLV